MLSQAALGPGSSPGAGSHSNPTPPPALVAGACRLLGPRAEGGFKPTSCGEAIDQTPAMDAGDGGGYRDGYGHSDGWALHTPPCQFPDLIRDPALYLTRASEPSWGRFGRPGRLILAYLCCFSWCDREFERLIRPYARSATFSIPRPGTRGCMTPRLVARGTASRESLHARLATVAGPPGGTVRKHRCARGRHAGARDARHGPCSPALHPHRTWPPCCA